MKYLSGQYLLDPAGPSFHFVWPAIIFFVLVAMIATTFAYAVEEQNNKRAPITRMAQRVRAIAWTVAIVALLIIGSRVADAQFPLVQSRIVLYLLALAYVGLLAYVGHFFRVVLPERNAAYELHQLRRQYLPKSRRRR